MWLPERKDKVRREWTVNTVTVQEGFKKKQVGRGDLSNVCIKSAECVVDGWI